jgi:hypothetical protein
VLFRSREALLRCFGILCATAHCYCITMEVPTPNTLQYVLKFQLLVAFRECGRKNVLKCVLRKLVEHAELYVMLCNQKIGSSVTCIGFIMVYINWQRKSQYSLHQV